MIDNILQRVELKVGRSEHSPTKIGLNDCNMFFFQNSIGNDVYVCIDWCAFIKCLQVSIFRKKHVATHFVQIFIFVSNNTFYKKIFYFPIHEKS